MGPWPQLALRDAVARRDFATANRITVDLTPAGGRPKNLAWRETAAKVAVKYAGYVDPGPLRPPFVKVPAEVQEAQRTRAERWLKLCAKYRHPVTA